MATQKNTIDRTMKKIKKLSKKSGLPMQAIGEKMGYPKASARQSVWQFLQTKNPSFLVVVRFAKAMGVSVEELV